MTKYIGLRLKWALLGAAVVILGNSLGYNITVNIWPSSVDVMQTRIDK